MSRKICTTSALSAAALWAGALAGCQHADNATTTNHQVARAPMAAEPGTRITDRQAADVQIGLGRSLEKHGDLAQAAAAYQEAARRDPKRADAWWRLGVLADRQSKFSEAAENYKKALELDGKNPDIYCDLGYSYYLQRRWAEAELMYQRALTLKSDHARSHNNWALVLARTDRWEEAMSQFREGGSDLSDSHVNMAFALTMDQRWDEARDQYQKALAANPASESARNGLRQIDSLIARTKPRLRTHQAAASPFEPPSVPVTVQQPSRAAATQRIIPLEVVPIPETPAGSSLARTFFRFPMEN
jgi:tetratricopeptide (TPR) repeat protein